MIKFSRTHDFQVHLSPSPSYPAAVNPPSFNWPENIDAQQYRLELKNISSNEQWTWEQVNSPMQLDHTLPLGDYQWRLITHEANKRDQASEWIDFQITAQLDNYLAPTAQQLFDLCDDREQWLMYFDEDIDTIKHYSTDIYAKLKQTASLSLPITGITYPNHYQRGQEEGKREAIANARLWIDRDLMVHTLLYKIWGEEVHGAEAINRLLKLAEWSPEGPASLLRPCTWGDEVGCSLARNLFLAYHWLSPLLTADEKSLFIRPMLVRIARQMIERLNEDNFKQYPGHSHTSRLPGYLGLAALTLYREHDREECQSWLTEALTIFRGIFPFYGGVDGSWVEGSFYASTYSKWYHPFFLATERLSGFSFYQHPFYKNFLHFAQDFIAPDQQTHPFGDGFWCRTDGKEWPGFFAQNPLRIYAGRFGNHADFQQSQALEDKISDYRLHLLDVVPTVKQIEFNTAVKSKIPDETKQAEQRVLSHFYAHAGLGKLTQQQMALYYRASVFGNSSHRHGDQGNIGFFDKNIGILVPTGSYGYRFGSKHHSQWTRQTIAHNLPLIDGQGQKLDDQSATAHMVQIRSESNYHIVTFDLSESYDKPLQRFFRSLVLVDGYGLIIVDNLVLNEDKKLNWRLHSPLNASQRTNNNTISLTDPANGIDPYKCHVISHSDILPTLVHGYEGELNIPERAIESDASKDVVHIDWSLPERRQHHLVGCCIKETMDFPTVRYLHDKEKQETIIELTVQDQLISITPIQD
ncbi:heparinase II/III domain-containing protein [Psychromonas sp. PT13]|uniref:heparinase II/III domain-containing protein n=1 Tax=Psychromonas sp. PT13 TaxID=3439547 RepID=UPI003EB9BA42